MYKVQLDTQIPFPASQSEVMMPFHCGCRREINWGNRGRHVLDLGWGKEKVSSEVLSENREIKRKATHQIVRLLALFSPTWLLECPSLFIPLDSQLEDSLGRRNWPVQEKKQILKSLQWYGWPYFQGRNRDEDVENTHVDTGGETEGGTNWEIRIDIYITPV